MGTIWQHAKFKISNFWKIRITLRPPTLFSQCVENIFHDSTINCDYSWGDFQCWVTQNQLCSSCPASFIIIQPGPVTIFSSILSLHLFLLSSFFWWVSANGYLSVWRAHNLFLPTASWTMSRHPAVNNLFIIIRARSRGQSLRWWRW